MTSRLYFAYDGSLHGSWVSRYAIRMATRIPDHTLNVVHVRTGEIDEHNLSAAREQLEQESSAVGVTIDWTSVAPTGIVYVALASVIPDDRETLVVCGTRSRVTRSKYLDGSVSERFLTRGQRQALVIRVANPGLLGIPQNVLISVAGHPRRMRDALPVIELLVPDVASVHVLLVRKPESRFRTRSPEALNRFRNDGLAYVEQIEHELATILPSPAVSIDGAMRIARDVAAEVVEHANRVRARLILLGASERGWWDRRLSGNPLEEILRRANCDVAIYRGFP